MQDHWQGKKVAILGDSISDKCHVGTTKNYWQFLEESLGIEPWVYALNGWTFEGIPQQMENLMRDHGTEADAVIVFMGTNDFMCSIPLGEWYSTRAASVNRNGETVTLERRSFCMDKTTFRGRINIAMKQLKENFASSQIILLTPVHRAFACFSETNVQPDESFPNLCGEYVDSYVRCIKEAGNVWSVPVIDLHSLAGLFPAMDAYAHYFHDSETDRLHPAAAGHERIAEVLKYQLLSLPATFRNIK